MATQHPLVTRPRQVHLDFHTPPPIPGSDAFLESGFGGRP